MAYSSNLIMFNEFQEFIDEDQKTREVSFYWNHVIFPSWLMGFFCHRSSKCDTFGYCCIERSKESLFNNEFDLPKQHLVIIWEMFYYFFAIPKYLSFWLFKKRWRLSSVGQFSNSEIWKLSKSFLQKLAIKNLEKAMFLTPDVLN